MEKGKDRERDSDDIIWAPKSGHIKHSVNQWNFQLGEPKVFVRGGLLSVGP